MNTFTPIYDRAVKRKESEQNLLSLLPPVNTPQQISQIDDSRFLSNMAKGVNQADFRWQVIEKKWSQFEEAYLNFNVDALMGWSDEQWEALLQDSRIVRNWTKIAAVKNNTAFMYQLQQQYGTAAQFFASWDQKDQLGLTQYLKKMGSRLGGMTGPTFLRRMGWDAYILRPDVVRALQGAGLDIADQPSSLKDLRLVQNTFNQWHEQTGLPYSHLSKIAAYSTGENQIA